MIRVRIEMLDGSSVTFDPVNVDGQQVAATLAVKDGALIVGHPDGIDIFPLHTVKEAWRNVLQPPGS